MDATYHTPTETTTDEMYKIIYIQHTASLIPSTLFYMTCTFKLYLWTLLATTPILIHTIFKFCHQTSCVLKCGWISLEEQKLCSTQNYQSNITAQTLTMPYLRSQKGRWNKLQYYNKVHSKTNDIIQKIVVTNYIF